MSIFVYVYRQSDHPPEIL